MAKMADRLHDLLVKQARYRYETAISGAIRGVNQCAAALRDEMLTVCSAKEWRSAERAVLMDMNRTVRGIETWTSECRGAAELAERTVEILPAAGIHRELEALHEEFGGVRLGKKNGSIAVTTEPITLGGVSLGPFEIQLEVRRGLSDTPRVETVIRAVALDPCAAAADAEVTHPHVREGVPCLGEAAGMIRRHLAAGRLYDMFVVARQMLRTYNEESAYVKLEEWDTLPCADCGGVCESDAPCCIVCGDVMCECCRGDCYDCGDSLCGAHGRECVACNILLCDACVQLCFDCRKVLCGDCIEDERCEECKNERAKAEAEAEEETAATEGTTEGAAKAANS